MVQCKKTKKMYFGMTTREAIARMREHLRDIAKEKGTTLAQHFKDRRCFGQFSEYMNIVPIASVSSETMKRYTRSQRKKIMEYIEGQVVELVGGVEYEKVLNKRNPCKSFSGFGAPLSLFYDVQANCVYIDGKLALQLTK